MLSKYEKAPVRAFASQELFAIVLHLIYYIIIVLFGSLVFLVIVFDGSGDCLVCVYLKVELLLKLL